MVWSVVPTRGRNDEYFQALHALAPQMVEGVFSLCRHLRAMAVTPAERWCALLLGPRRQEAVETMNSLLRIEMISGANAEQDFLRKYGKLLRETLSNLTKSIVTSPGNMHTTRVTKAANETNLTPNTPEKQIELTSSALRRHWQPLLDLGEHIRDAEMNTKRTILRSAFATQNNIAWKKLMLATPLPGQLKPVHAADMHRSWEILDESAASWYDEDEQKSDSRFSVDDDHHNRGKPGIHEISATLDVLTASKKRPKRFWLKSAATGCKHVYLLKGNDQPEVDQRVVQLFRTFNDLLASTPGCRHAMPGMRVRTFNVTKIGPRTGLFRWVEGQTSFHRVYQSWRQRNIQSRLVHHHQQKKKAQANRAATKKPTNGIEVAPHRPSDEYFSTFLSELQIALAHKDSAAKSLVLAIVERCKAKTPAMGSAHVDCVHQDDWGGIESFLAKLT